MTITSYAVAQVTALTIFCVLGCWLTAKEGIRLRDAAVWMLVVSAATLVGARLGNVFLTSITSPERWDQLWLPEFGRFYFPTAIVGALLAGWATSRQIGLDLWRVGDILALAAAPAMAVVRLGCFAAGCCFGEESTVPWAVTFPVGSPAHWHQMQYRFEAILSGPRPVHPTQLYLFACAVIIALTLWGLWRRGHQPGVIFLTGVTLFLLSRLWVDSYRAAVGPFDPGRDQLFCVFALVVLSIVIAWRCRLEKVGRRPDRENPAR